MMTSWCAGSGGQQVGEDARMCCPHVIAVRARVSAAANASGISRLGIVARSTFATGMGDRHTRGPALQDPPEPGALHLGHVADQAVQGEPGGCHRARLARVIVNAFALE